jgi:hypothetical protein
LDSNTRQRVAMRIHHTLLRHLGETVDLRALLDGSAEGSEALWVCESSEDQELVDLARQFQRASLPVAQPAAASAATVGGRERQETSWAQNTTGFGVSRPVELGGASREAADGAAHWLHPSSWFGALRTSHR